MIKLLKNVVAFLFIAGVSSAIGQQITGGGGGCSTTCTYTGTQTITQGTTNANVIASTGYSLTGSNAQSLLDLAGTLNTSGSPDIIALRITDTARGASTRWINLYGGASGTTSLFNVTRVGDVNTLGNVSAATFSTSTGNYLQFGARAYIDSPADAQFSIHNNAGTRASILAGGTAVPTLSSCGGSPSIDAASTSLAGEVTEGTTATGCVVTFVPAYSNKPFCVVTSQTTLISFAYVVTASAITVTNTSASGDVFNYVCVAH